ncbi:GntR family transcriptional regulator [Leifsonia kafniensis]|uniref:GntR family transcriptional regulator n=1 Tax=Leifsonia kafniensis TaxID=475957 RepID=A0ABP7KDC1_9MICO
MQIEIDPQSQVPIYQQIRDRTVEAIAAGVLVPGEQLASVRQLALEFGINVQTVSKAYDALRQEGLIRTNHKSGSVIARGPGDVAAAPSFADDWSARLSTLLAEAIVQGVTDAEILARTEQIVQSFAARRSAAPHSPHTESLEIA